jgi:broad specificity phosphatase PhoE
VTDIWLVRHGATAWTTSGQHTGTTDVPLTPEGETEARALGPHLADHAFALVLTSPLERARRTCELAGFGDRAEIVDDLREWNYGDAEGRTAEQVREDHPGWTVWNEPLGESIEALGARADAVLDRISGTAGTSLCFAHGHLLRVLAVRWVGLPPDDGRLLALDPGSVSVLGHERETRVLRRWNWRPSP